MNRLVTHYESDIRPQKTRFRIAAALFLVVAVVCVGQARNRRLQEKTYTELLRAKSGLDKLKQANLNRRHALTTLKAQLGNNSETNSPERLVYGKLDEIRERLRPDDLTVASIEKKGGEVSIPYTLKFTNHDYNTFLNAISYLQEGTLPLAPVSSIVISQAVDAGKNVVLFTVTGKVLINEKRKP